ncbi:hypothetical protein C4588_01600 [Candidatus Parcubacteria bacterium]|nr:MAG: hypothetical protein C4588_01600 [Candidatus Parcubacteria bacterium]
MKSEEEIRREIYQIENQMVALSDQIWAILRESKERMQKICELIDNGEVVPQNELVFLRSMVGCLIAEIGARSYFAKADEF